MPDGVRSQHGAGSVSRPRGTVMARDASGALNAVLGVADHNGWAVCVTVAVSRGLPVVVDRRRVGLIEPGVPSQPYHHETVGMPLPEAEKLVVRVRESVMRTTLARMSQLRDDLQPPYTIVAMTLRNPPLTYSSGHRRRGAQVVPCDVSRGRHDVPRCAVHRCPASGYCTGASRSRRRGRACRRSAGRQPERARAVPSERR